MSLSIGLGLAERGLLPAGVERWGIRRLLRQRLREESPPGFEEQLRSGPLALAVEKANEQHYELPPEFFEQVLGRNLKYSAGYWPAGVRTLDEAEEAMLALSVERAGIEDGQDVLDLGCGWGSLSLWIARRCPNSRVLGVSNSRPQREFIEARRPANLEIVTADMNAFDTDRRFDRIVSIEMFEHMRNYELLMRRVAGWLAPGGKLFVHVFCHDHLAYPFETRGEDDWMGRHFFTGGLMPSFDLLPRFAGDLHLEDSWRVNGTHYQRTAEAWYDRLLERRATVLPVLARTYGQGRARRWFHRWRLFFLACAELWGYRGGREWLVGHYRFARR